MGSPLSFDKYEGLGNDFLLVDALREDDVPSSLAAKLCDRRLGVGGDGVLLVLPPRAAGAEVRMRVVNADGSVPEMCGNGIRCVALRHTRARGLTRAVVPVDTDAGVRACAVDDEGGAGRVSVDMGIVRVLGERAVVVDGRSVPLLVADAGNPHAILFGDFDRPTIDHLGPRIATSEAFPRGTNVEFARVREGAIDLVVWERGVGVTMACGTGACATAVTAVHRGLLPPGRPVRVDLPGGSLTIDLAPDGTVTMTGPARFVFSGRLDRAG